VLEIIRWEIHISFSILFKNKITELIMRISIVNASLYEEGKHDFISKLHELGYGPNQTRDDFNFFRCQSDKSNDNY
jgi:hypothetical protein